MFFVVIAWYNWKVHFPLPSADFKKYEFHRNYLHLDYYTIPQTPKYIQDQWKLRNQLNDKLEIILQKINSVWLFCREVSFGLKTIFTRLSRYSAIHLTFLLKKL